MNDISPEERLLRLIRKGEKLSPGENSAVAVSSERPTKIIPKKAGYLQFITLQRLLLGGLVISFIYLVICLVGFFLGGREYRAVGFFDEGSPVLSGKVMIESETKPYSFYSDVITGRQIFDTISVEPDEEKQPDINITEQIKDMHLLGIIVEDNPQAIIEDAKIGKTYFLRKGELLGDMVLKEIGDGKVTLEFHGQSFDLFL